MVTSTTFKLNFKRQINRINKKPIIAYHIYNILVGMIKTQEMLGIIIEKAKDPKKPRLFVKQYHTFLLVKKSIF